MEIIQKWWLSLAILALASTIFGFSVVGALNSQESNEVVFEPFYGVAPELAVELEQIVLADDQVKELVNERVFALHVGADTIEIQQFQIAVGVRLAGNVNHEDFRDWVKNGRHDSPIISEYVGALTVGYNKQYTFSINRSTNSISTIEIIKDLGDTIPEVSGKEMQAALDIAFADTKVQQILADKSYKLIPNDSIGAWHVRSSLLGVSFLISFDTPYFINETLPDVSLGSYTYSGRAVSIIVNVSLQENRVATILVQTELGVN